MQDLTIFKDSIAKMGYPAYLEHIAEEASELTFAALKLARKLRDENPTPANIDDLYKNFVEEIVDVNSLLYILLDDDKKLEKDFVTMRNKKMDRWRARLGRAKEEQEAED